MGNLTGNLSEDDSGKIVTKLEVKEAELVGQGSLRVTLLYVSQSQVGSWGGAE